VLVVDCGKAVLLLIHSLVFPTRARPFVCVKLGMEELGLLWMAMSSIALLGRMRWTIRLTGSL
jgi:hypothetical protein